MHEIGVEFGEEFNETITWAVAPKYECFQTFQMQTICQNPLLKEEFNWKYLRTLGGHLKIAAIVSIYIIYTYSINAINITFATVTC